MSIFKKNFISLFVNDLVIDHPTPSNISYLWNFGSLAAFALVIQIISGIFLAMHYVPHIDYAFISVEHVMRDVNSGWLVRYLHANCASFFFIFVYLHMFRGIYYGAYYGSNKETWFIGVTIYILMMAAAFFGYVLPWGQMSFWGATVITNFFSVVPFVGNEIVSWLWGGFSVNNATLNRFFSLHFFIPFIILAMVFLHLVALHNASHSNPAGLYSISNTNADLVNEVTFYPYFIIKDAVGLFVFLFTLSIVVFFFPNLLGHPDNYILANALATPAHIVPEWYFLPFYAILRSIPNKILGVLAMFSAILVLYLLPFVGSSLTSTGSFRRYFKLIFWLFAIDCLILGWIGGNPVEYPFYKIGQIATIAYFSFFLVFLPLFKLFNTITIRPKPRSIFERYVEIWDLETGALLWPNLISVFFERLDTKGFGKTIWWVIKRIVWLFVDISETIYKKYSKGISLEKQFAVYFKEQTRLEEVAHMCFIDGDDGILRQLFRDSEWRPIVYYIKHTIDMFKRIVVKIKSQPSKIQHKVYSKILEFHNNQAIIEISQYLQLVVEFLNSVFFQKLMLFTIICFSILLVFIPYLIFYSFLFRTVYFSFLILHTYFSLKNIIKDYFKNYRLSLHILQIFIVILIYIIRKLFY